MRAVAKRYRGKVSFYSLWNEPNLENYLLPQLDEDQGRHRGHGRQAPARAVHRRLPVHPRRRPPARKRVLLGETSAISSPRDTLYSALCLNRRGRPYTGAIKLEQGCSKPAMLPIGGLAVHPYNQSALG